MSGRAHREFSTRLTTRRSSWFQGAGVAVVVGALVAAAGSEPWLWLLPAVLLLFAPLIGALMFPVASMWLEGAVLLHEVRGTRTQVDLSRLESVKRDWVPYQGDSLELTDESGRRICLGSLADTPEALRRAVGQRARVLRSSTDLYDRTRRRLLLLDR